MSSPPSPHRSPSLAPPSRTSWPMARDASKGSAFSPNTMSTPSPPSIQSSPSPPNMNSAPAPPRMKSLPSIPKASAASSWPISRASLPAPPKSSSPMPPPAAITSLPSSPCRKDAPSPSRMMSSPRPPRRVLTPAPPIRRSLPSPPQRWSSPRPPTRMSRWLEPPRTTCSPPLNCSRLSYSRVPSTSGASTVAVARSTIVWPIAPRKGSISADTGSGIDCTAWSTSRMYCIDEKTWAGICAPPSWMSVLRAMIIANELFSSSAIMFMPAVRAR